MGKIDIITKEYMLKSHYFADAFNSSIFKGEQVVKAEQLSLQEMDTAEFGVFLEENTLEIVQKYRDILKKSILMHDGTTAFLLLGIENQSEIHYAMPVKNMIYDALNYGKQVRKITEKHKEKNKLKGNEFLSGFSKTDVIMPVITLTVYFGNDEWDGPRCLKDMFPENINAEILESVNDYKLHMIVPAEIEDFSVFRTDLGKAMEFIAASNDPDAIKKIKQNRMFEKVHADTVVLINACTGSNIKISQGEEVVNVCKGIDMIKAEGKDEGKLEILFGLVKDGLLQLTEAVTRSSLSQEEFLEKMKKAGY